jgi:hypothetical protein
LRVLGKDFVGGYVSGMLRNRFLVGKVERRTDQNGEDYWFVLRSARFIQKLFHGYPQYYPRVGGGVIAYPNEVAVPYEVGNLNEVAVPYEEADLIGLPFPMRKPTL